MVGTSTHGGNRLSRAELKRLAVKYDDLGVTTFPLLPRGKVPPRGFSWTEHAADALTVDELPWETVATLVLPTLAPPSQIHSVQHKIYTALRGSMWIQRAVLETVPTGVGDRDARIFNLARRLTPMHLGDDELRGAFDWWWQLAKPVVRTKARHVTTGCSSSTLGRRACCAASTSALRAVG